MAQDSRNRVIDLAETADFMLGAFRVSPALCTISGAGCQRGLQPRVMQVLVALAQARPGVVSHDKLIARCWDGRIVGNDALNRCIVVLRNLAHDLDGWFEVQNVARVGYRLVAPEDVSGQVAATPPRRKLLLVVVAFSLALGGIAIIWSKSNSAPATSRIADRAVTSEAQRLYLVGRAMLRTGNPQVAGDARVLFQQAIAIDPKYALGWVGLAEALRSEASLKGAEGVIAALPIARADLRRAQSLAPDLAEAHGQLGALMGLTSAEAQQQLLIAAKLDPLSAEAEIGLAVARRASGDFSGEIAAYRRARELDRTWYRPTRDLAIAAAEMGDREAARQIAHSVITPFPGCGGISARIDWIYGDMAESAHCWAESAKVESIWSAPARVALASARLTLGLSRDGKSAAPIHILDPRPPQGRVWMAFPPPATVWQQHNRSADAALAYRMENLVAAKLMLNEGRHDELVATYRGPTGLLGLKQGALIQAADLPAIPIIALALYRSGRVGESNNLLLDATRVVDTAYRNGPVPFSFDVEAAAIAAVRGQTDRAIAALRRARSRGWINNGWCDLLNLRDEPAFIGLRPDAKFDAILAELDTQYSRERRLLLRFGAESQISDSTDL